MLDLQSVARSLVAVQLRGAKLSPIFASSLEQHLEPFENTRGIHWR